MKIIKKNYFEKKRRFKISTARTTKLRRNKMFITTNTDNRPLYKNTELFNLFISFIIIMSCFVFTDTVSAEDLAPSAGSSDVSDVAGSFSYSYPIQVPPGRGGLAPQVSLNYSSSSRNSWTGVGWDLSLGYIERSTEDGKPDYDDWAQVFKPRPIKRNKPSPSDPKSRLHHLEIF
jgi:hypothetical protein